MNESAAHRDMIIDLQGVTKTYGRSLAVDNVTLQIPRGSVFGLIGPNGAGKSTLIKMLMGMLSTTAGRARVLGFDVRANADRIQQLVGYVPEVPSIYRWMTVDEVIGFCRALRVGWNEALCEELLDRLELERSKRVKQLSKGMQTKLSLLLALAYEPEVLILDEPTSGLDPVVREEFLEPVLQIVCERECTVLFSSHAIEDVERLADQVGLLLEGRLHLHSPVEELLSKTRRLRAVLSHGCLPTATPDGAIWQHVDRREWWLTVTNFSSQTVPDLKAANRLENVEVSDASLSELFKDYVKGHKAKGQMVQS